MPTDDLAAGVSRTLMDAYPASGDEVAIALTIRTIADLVVASGVDRTVVDRRMDGWRRRLPGNLWPLGTVEAAIDDLAAALRRPPRWQAERLPRLLKEHWHLVLAAVGLLTAAAAAVIALGYQRYYDALGLSAQDVGLTPAETLTRSLGTVLLIVVATGIATLILLPMVAVVAPLLERGEDNGVAGATKAIAVPHVTGEDAGTILALAVSILALLGLSGWAATAAYTGAVLAVITRPGWQRAAATAVAAGAGSLLLPADVPVWVPIAAAALGCVLAGGFDNRGRAQRRALPEVAVAAFRLHPLVVLVGGVVLAAILTFATVGSSVMQGSRLAGMVRSGRTVNPPAFLGVPILDVHARPASVHWSSGTDRRASPDVSGCLLYLGRDDSDVLVYQVRRARNLTSPSHDRAPKIVGRGLLRIPRDDAVVVVGSNGQCLAPDDS